jgi:GntR family transcriptional regulator, galactonate operon transcriptional repressor
MHANAYHRKLYQYIVEEIGQRIVRGHYASDEILPTEDQLSEEMRVSRGVLREAIKVLAQKGLIQTRPRVGTQVLSRENWNLFDPDVLVWRLQIEDKTTFLKNVTEVRRLIESEAARQAARRATDLEVLDIKAILSQLQALLSDDDHYLYEEYLSIDIRFHATILEASHNDLLSQIGRTIRNAVHEARQNDTTEISIQRESLSFHAAVADGIAKKDPRAAYEASQAMFDNVWQHIVRS